MIAYILRRVMLIVPTMLGIMFVTFLVVQFAPGGPVERMIAQLTGTDAGATARFSGRRQRIRRGPRAWRDAGRRLGAIQISRARKASTRNSSRASKSNSASTSRPMSASAC